MWKICSSAINGRLAFSTTSAKNLELKNPFPEDCLNGAPIFVCHH